MNISVSCMNGRNERLRGPAGTDGYPSGQAQKNDEYSGERRISNLDKNPNIDNIITEFFKRGK